MALGASLAGCRDVPDREVETRTEPGSGAVPAVGELGDAEDPLDQSAVQLRGLPYKASLEDVRSFLGDYAAELSGAGIQLVLNRDGRSSGFARVQFATFEIAVRCRDELHLRSMEDRYVEVFLYSERPSKGRRRAGVLEDVPVPGEPTQQSWTVVDVSGITREHVVRECRTHMSEPRRRRLLLSMLGVALSPEVRSYLKQMDQGLKHFLAQYPREFSVDGGKGCEYVTYAPIRLSQAIDGFDEPEATSSAPATVPTPGAVGSTEPRQEPASPMPNQWPTPGARGLDTPSYWGTPSAVPWADNLRAPWLPPWPAGGLGPPGATSLAAGDVNPTWAPPPAWPMPVTQFGWPGLQPPPPSGTWNNLVSGTAPQATGSGTALDSGTATRCSSACSSFPAVQACPATQTVPDTASTTIRLRGLPFSASEQDVLAFFAQYDVVDLIADGPKVVSLMLRPNGRPSGQAVVSMRSRGDAELAQRVLDGQWMGSRYIEVFNCDDFGNVETPKPEGSSCAVSAPPAAPPQTVSVAPAVQESSPPLFTGALPWSQTAPWNNAAFPQSVRPSAGAGTDEMSWEAMFEFLHTAATQAGAQEDLSGRMHFGGPLPGGPSLLADGGLPAVPPPGAWSGCSPAVRGQSI